jgi:stage II sporulation protein D
MRRPFLIALVFLFCANDYARAEGLSRIDKLRVLYSNQFSFDRRGIPLITIGVLEGQKEVSIEARSGVRVLPDGEDGSEVIGGNRWTIRLKRSKAASIEHFVVLARGRIERIVELQKERTVWKQRGRSPKMIEIGTVFGIKGRVFDNRALLLVDGPFKGRRVARRHAERYLKKGWVKRVATIAQLAKRPSARLRATDGQTKIRLRDAIWFASRSSRRALAIRVNGKLRRYWGQLTVTVDRNGKLAVVNSVPADKLLAGLVPSEIFPSAPGAALQAQAIAARSDLLSKIGTRHFVDPYLICSKQHCQVYRGAGHEHPRTTDAVVATRGLVLGRKHGGLVNAVYHANSGGHTEHNEHVWPGPPDSTLRGKLDAEGTMIRGFQNGVTEKNIARWLMLKPDSWSARSGVNLDKLRWTVRRSITRLSLGVKALGVGRVKGIRVLARGRSGRAYLVEVSGSRGKGRIRGELNIRRAFGNLRSSMFIVSPVTTPSGQLEGFQFRGGGWGHGVGMCQSGAIGMAKSNKTFRQILGHYYTSAIIRRVY